MNNVMDNDYTIGTASFEIILLVIGAFLLGAMLCYLLRMLGLCCRSKKPALTTHTANEALQRSPQTSLSAINTEIQTDTALPSNTNPVADSVPSSGSLIEGDSTVYGADISSLLRSSSDATQIRVERSTPSASGSFENRARESLANLREEPRTTNGSIDYTLDMPMPDDSQVDDLKKLEGIGPRIEKLLNDAGIKSYAKLATMDRNHLKELLEQGGSEFSMNEPKSWPYQAELAAKENWSRLKEYQAFLLDGQQP